MKIFTLTNFFDWLTLSDIVDEVKQFQPDEIYCLVHCEWDGWNFQQFVESIRLNYSQSVNITVISSPMQTRFLKFCEENNVHHQDMDCTLIDPIVSNFVKTEFAHSAEELQKNYLSNDLRLYTSYNGSSGSLSRCITVDMLAKHNLLQHGYYSFNNISGRNPDGLPGRNPEGRNSPGYDFKHYDGVYRVLDHVDVGSTARIPAHYFDALIDIVTETTAEDGLVLGDKIQKPLLWCKPFLVVGCVDYHKNLVSRYGLKLYDEIFDYSFDSVDDLEQRIDMIVQQVKKIKDCDLKQIYRQCWPKLWYNNCKFRLYTALKHRHAVTSMLDLLEQNEHVHSKYCQSTIVEVYSRYINDSDTFLNNHNFDKYLYENI